jgi:hypothetical protein
MYVWLGFGGSRDWKWKKGRREGDEKKAGPAKKKKTRRVKRQEDQCKKMADGYGQQQQPGSPDSSPHSDNESGGGHYQDASVREQDRFLPIANVSRIMKKALPSNAKISKDAKETVQECVSEFISFITGTFWVI